MKLAGILALPVLLCAFGVVACSSSTEILEEEESSSHLEKKEIPPTDGPKGKSTATTTAAQEPAATTKTASERDAKAMCRACLEAEPMLIPVVACSEKCSPDDEACPAACLEDGGCTSEPGDRCHAKIEECTSLCKPDVEIVAPPAEDDRSSLTPECQRCLGVNAQTSAMFDCAVAAKDAAGLELCKKMTCDDACMETIGDCKVECSAP